MQAVIHLELMRALEYTYGQRTLRKQVVQFPDVLFYDLDNYSDTLVVHYAVDIIQKAEKVVVVIQAHPEAQVGSVRSLLESLVGSGKKCLVLFTGENALAERMLKPLEKSQVKMNISEAEQWEEVNAFLTGAPATD
jgi:hypothetical protein